MEADRKFLFFDGSYLLYRSWSRIKSMHRLPKPVIDKNGNVVLNESGEPVLIDTYDITPGEVVKMFIWIIGKFTREICNAEKVIILWDKTPYYKERFIDTFKTDRIHYNESMLEDMNIDDDPIEYRYVEAEAKANTIKFEAKDFIINELWKVGIISIIHEGYEADDLIYLIGQKLKDTGIRTGVHATDYDWEYWIAPGMTLFNNRGEVTYDQICRELSNENEVEVTDPFKWKVYQDSVYGSHNNLQYAVIDESLPKNKIFSQLDKGDFTGLNEDLCKRQIQSYDIYSYPYIDEVLSDIDFKLFKFGKVSSVNEKRDVLNNQGVNISDNYYKELIEFLNPELYASD